MQRKNRRFASHASKHKKLIVLMCVVAIFGLMFAYKNVQTLKPAYRLLEPNADYAMVAHLYPDIKPTYPNVVPDIVHYMQFLHSDVSFIFYLSVKSVIKYHKPALIMIHCDCDTLTGKYTNIYYTFSS